MADDLPPTDTSVPKFIQICTADYTSRTGTKGFVVIALGDDGRVYQSKDDGWVRFEKRFDGTGQLKSAPKSFPSQKDKSIPNPADDPNW